MKHCVIAAVLGLSVGLAARADGAAEPVTCSPETERHQEIGVWRGETTVVRLHDPIEVGPQVAGISMRQGRLRAVKAAPEPGSLRREEYLDRVDLKAGDDGSGDARVVEVQVPAETPAGVYRSGMLVIRVVDRVLPPPREWKYHLDLWQHPWAVARTEGVEPFSTRHYLAMRPLWRQLAAAGQKSLTVTLVDQPWNHQCRDAYRSMVGRVRRRDGSWKFDYSVFDEYVKFGIECGLGAEIACYTMCPWEYICRYEQEGEGVKAVKAVPGTPEFEFFWGDFLTDFAAHLRERGWYDRTFISMDERSPEDVRRIVEFVRARAPGLRISMAGNRRPSDFKGIVIDSYSQILLEGHVTPEFLAEAAERRRQGLVTTAYVCCVPERPNTLLKSADGEAFWCGFYPAAAGLDGFLRWAYNSWPENPGADASYGEWLAGDTFLAYPGGDASWRFEELKRGVAAAEKLRILEESGKFAEDIGNLKLRYDVNAANAGTEDFRRLRADTLELVNRD